MKIKANQSQQRNKPKEAPKKPEKAPFFLPSILSKPGSSLADTTDTTTSAAEEAVKLASERSRIAKLQRTHGADLHISPFTSLLRAANASADFSSFIDYFKSLSPAKADLEIRSLDPRARGYGNEFTAFVRALTARLKAKRDFELVNAWMAVFLKVHGDVIGALEEGEEGGRLDDEDDVMSVDGDDDAGSLQAALVEWKIEQDREGKRMGDLVGYCRGIVGFLRSAR